MVENNFPVKSTKQPVNETQAKQDKKVNEGNRFDIQPDLSRTGLDYQNDNEANANDPGSVQDDFSVHALVILCILYF